MYHGWNGGWASGGFGMPWGGLFMGVLFTALIVLLVLAIVRMGRGKSKKADLEGGMERGIDILISRFSRGEIDAETFRSMRAELDALR